MGRTSGSLFPSPLEGEGARRADEEFGTIQAFDRLDRSEPLIRLGLRPIHLLPQGEKGRKKHGMDR